MNVKIHANSQAMAKWLERVVKSLGNHSDRLNAINIFPVADGDTGSNLYLTARAAHDAISKLETDSIGEMLTMASRAAMESARGNSGTLLAVFLAGMAEPLCGVERLTAPLLATALERGKVRAWSALSEPVAGTMLSVMEVAANVARRTHRASSLEPASKAALTEILEAICVAAEDAVVATESELGVLHEAQIVDAGAVGMLIILDELRGALQGHVIDPDEYAQFHGYDIQDPHIHQGVSNGSGVEVMCTINLDALGAATLRGQLDALGDSVIMSPVNPTNEGYRWRVHVHVPVAEDALNAIRGVGSPVNVSITDLCTHDG
ncbi:DAK2 domain-containing protein [Paeniglutamicibacter kerguelensis]|uniref:Dihydroxyacetone kinase-like predicted kinase n=2 Tax=Paeniglutamicibacter kerguelensis TaxID=254788 RepID=A0ABS4XAT8_9MICC|nr:dihydroxyacetone kinase-like predicted kinase [Paeniglutamicibacter kerguelensis]